MRRIRYDKDVRPSDIGRRQLITATAGLALAWGSRRSWAAVPGNDRFKGLPKSRYSTDEPATPIEIATTRTRFRELEDVGGGRATQVGRDERTGGTGHGVGAGGKAASGAPLKLHC